MRGPFDGPVSRAGIERRVEAHPIEGGPEEMREAFRALVLGDARAPSEIVEADVAEEAGGLTVRPAGTGRGRILWLHGGGYVFGAPETHLRPAARLATLTGTAVSLPRYPLAPEARWPAQKDAALRAIEAARADGPVALAGDSAGGHLALVAALAADVAGLALFAPNTDRTGLNGMRRALTPHDPMNEDEGDRALARKCFGDMADDHPDVSPALADLSALPPLHIEVGATEVLLGDAVALHALATAAGARATLHFDPGLIHMAQLWTPWWPVAEASLARAAAHLSECLSP